MSETELSAHFAQAYLSGKSATEIGEPYFLSKIQVQLRLKRHGIPLRSLSEAMRLVAQKRYSSNN